MAKILNAQEVEAALPVAGRWTFAADGIDAMFKFADFAEAFAFMTEVAKAAEAADHHPEWQNTYNKVTIRLTTHDAGGVTDKDIALARSIDDILAKLPRKAQ